MSGTLALSPSVIWAVIGGMFVANLAVRFVPLAVVTRLRLPEPVMRWLSYVPVSVMGALVASEVLRPGGDFAAPWASPWFVAGSLASALVFWKSRSFLGATTAGMVVFVVLRMMG